MHDGSLLRMQWFIDQYASKLPEDNIKVLDVGSYAVNGSYRELFNDGKYQYTGLDMEEGPNVDLVVKHPYAWSEIETDSYDIVISGQAFEHIEFFWKTMEEIARVLRKDGLVCIIAPNVCSEHRYPVDCYRYFADGMIALARYVCFEPLHAHANCAPAPYAADWYSKRRSDAILVARKPYEGNPQHPDFRTYTCEPADPGALRDDFFPYRRTKGLKRLGYEILMRLHKSR